MESHKRKIIANLLNELLASSSSSSSSDDEEELEELLHPSRPKEKSRPIIHNPMDDYNDEEFHKNFRVRKQTAEKLIQLYAHKISQDAVLGRPPTEARTQVLVYLWYAGNRTPLKYIAKRFGVGSSTVLHMSNRIAQFFALEIGPSVIKFPESEQEKSAVATAFEEISGFPDTLGAIGETHISIRPPKTKPTKNRHSPINITLQAICDAEKRFLDVYACVGRAAPNQANEIYENSSIAMTLKEKCGPLHIVGGANYPIRTYLLTPFTDSVRIQSTYNTKLSLALESVENALVDLKNRFQRLRHLDKREAYDIEMMIVSACVVHNICIENNEPAFGDRTAAVPTSISSEVWDGNEAAKLLGEEKRYVISNFMA